MLTLTVFSRISVFQDDDVYDFNEHDPNLDSQDVELGVASTAHDTPADTTHDTPADDTNTSIYTSDNLPPPTSITDER